MSFPLLELPMEMVTAILNFADDKIILKLAQASKTTNQIAWSIFLKRNQTINRIKFIEMSCGKIFVQFSFGRDNIRSKFAFLEALKCIQAPIFYTNSEGLHTTMTEDETIQFFDQMLPKSERITINSLEFDPTPSMISLISKIFEGEFVTDLTFKLEDYIDAFKSLKYLVSKLETTSIHVHLGKDYPAFYLRELANVVDFISIWGSSSESNMAFRAHDILKRRCSHLDFTNSSFTFGSYNIVYLSHLLSDSIGDKQFFFTARTADNYPPHTDYERRGFARKNHVAEIFKDKKSDQNRVELRHASVKRQ